MGLRLNWDVTTNGTSETLEEELSRPRWMRKRYFLLAIFGAILAVGGAVLLLDWINGGFGDLPIFFDESALSAYPELSAAVNAEVVALRVGDDDAYLNLQRSSHVGWMASQTERFMHYQTLKAEHDVNLTGTVLDAEVEDQRARVTVKEIINGREYEVMWFYWLYAEGWRHVPPDLTWWGSLREHKAQYVDVTYYARDEAFAHALGALLDEWMRQGCGRLKCPAPWPRLRAEVRVEARLVPYVVDGVLIVPSPYVTRAPLDGEIDPMLKAQLAPAAAEILIADFAPPGSDLLTDTLPKWLMQF